MNWTTFFEIYAGILYKKQAKLQCLPNERRVSTLC